MKLTLPNITNWETIYVRSFLSFSNDFQNVHIETNQEASLIDGEKTVKGAIEIVDYLISKLKNPFSPASNDKNLKTWFSFGERIVKSNTTKENISPLLGLLQRLDKHLSTLVFIDNNKFTVGDLYLFSSIYPSYEFFEKDDRNRNVNVTRWFDHIQHLDKSNFFKRLEINLLYTEPKKLEPKKKEEKPQQPQENQKGEKGEKGGNKGGNKGGEKGGEKGEENNFGKLEIKVGRIEEIDNHPSSEVDSLYVSKIDVGEKEKRTIVSGLRKFIDKEKLLGTKVLVLCNLKERPMRGVNSNGMVLCASNESHTQVEILRVNEETPVGDVIKCEGSEYQPEKVLNPKKKIWESVQQHLKTNQQFQATYKGVLLTTSKGDIKCSSIVGNIG
eukprot:TRINITY_DN3092_c0_g3_i1.p1 TRINITY_DN3092_c0_g3~~TRINITY_DN3092_c0_g3_i1.p1  ORF type:complete len:386 (-),score=144.57 TRINITY_DN3092_c0_g3_i1:86-1243(-)